MKPPGTPHKNPKTWPFHWCVQFSS